MGGGDLFAATVGLYVTFGFTAVWYLVLKLLESTAPASFGKHMLKAFWFLKFHVIAFIIGGTADLAHDALVTPNDFRNMFLRRTRSGKEERGLILRAIHGHHPVFLSRFYSVYSVCSGAPRLAHSTG